jgi:hypothetical protein
MNMALLLYCVAEADAAVNHRLEGVSRVPVFGFKRQALTTFASESTTAEVWMSPPLAETALKFHQVLRELFRSTTIIPFRFPTILASEQQLNQHLDERAQDYRCLLQKFRSSVQLEVFITDSPTAGDLGAAGSGTEYLRGKQKRIDALERLASELQAAAGEAAKLWRTRIIQSGLRCFALVERERVSGIRRALEGVPLPDAFGLRVSGPWPVSEFLELHET